MTFVVTDACIKCKYMDCVEVCPTDAFRDGENMLVIDPNACIDCNLCPVECPAEAILSDIEPASEQWIELNARLARDWPEITVKRDPLPDADEHKGETGKLEEYFSAEPGEGD